MKLLKKIQKSKRSSKFYEDFNKCVINIDKVMQKMVIYVLWWAIEQLRIKYSY
jgi:hypothetical protein